MVNRKFAAWTLLVLFLGGRFVAPVLLGAFLHGLNQAGLFIGAGGVDGTRLVNFGHVICDSRDDGDTADQQHQRAIMAGIPEQDVNAFVQIAVKNYCPAPSIGEFAERSI